MSHSELNVSVKIQQGQSISEPIKSGKWTQDQNLRYVLFLDKNKAKFCAKMKKKKIRLFEKMSQFIGTRSSIQCRTHHQKYESKFGDSKSIISIYKEEIGLNQYKKYMRELLTASFSLDGDQKQEKGYDKNIEKPIKQEVEVKQKIQTGMQTDHPFQWIQQNSYMNKGMQRFEALNFLGYQPFS